MAVASNIRDVKVPLEEVDGDFAVVTGDGLVRQRLLLGFRTFPGDFHDLPEWGAGLEEELNRTPTPASLAQLKNRIRRFLDTIPLVDDYSVDVVREDGEAVGVSTKVTYQGRDVNLPEVRLA
tara:strand:+ start:2699 stop:3064 length:366 start_codon:yes stop_codon:yes gene_type:complete